MANDKANRRQLLPRWSAWREAHRFQCLSVALALMAFSPIGLYLAARGGEAHWIWALLGLAAAGNALAVVS